MPPPQQPIEVALSDGAWYLFQQHRARRPTSPSSRPRRPIMLSVKLPGIGHRTPPSRGARKRTGRVPASVRWRRGRLGPDSPCDEASAARPAEGPGSIPVSSAWSDIFDLSAAGLFPGDDAVRGVNTERDAFPGRGQVPTAAARRIHQLSSGCRPLEWYGPANSGCYDSERVQGLGANPGRCEVGAWPRIARQDW